MNSLNIFKKQILMAILLYFSMKPQNSQQWILYDTIKSWNTLQKYLTHCTLFGLIWYVHDLCLWSHLPIPSPPLPPPQNTVRQLTHLGIIIVFFQRL